MSEPIRVLFVCTANICRSAYAEVYARDLAQRTAGDARVAVLSAGTHGFDAAPMDPPMAAQLRERGIDPSAFRSRPLSPALLRWAEVVLTMEAAHRRFVVEDHPTAAARTFTLGRFAGRAEGAGAPAGRDLIEAAHRRRSRERREEDVPDPYRRGDDVAARTAERISALVDVVVPALGRVSGG